MSCRCYLIYCFYSYRNKNCFIFISKFSYTYLLTFLELTSAETKQNYELLFT